MKIWQVVKAAWQAAADNRWLTGLTIGIQVALGVASLPFNGEEQDLGAGLRLFGALLIVAQLVLLPLIQAGCLAFANAVASDGARVAGMSGFWAAARTHYRRMLGFEGLMIGMGFGLAVLGVILAAIVNFVAGWSAVSGVLTVLMALVPFGVALYLLLVTVAMAPSAIVVERLGVFAAARRGLSIGRKALAALLVITLVIMLTLAPLLALLMLSGFLERHGAGGATSVLSVVVQGLASGLSWILFSVVSVHVYRHYAERAGSSVAP